MRNRLCAVVLACAAALPGTSVSAAPRFERISPRPAGWGKAPTVSATGRYVVWIANPGKTDWLETNTQVWIADRVRRTSELVSVTPAGKPSASGTSVLHTDVSADGRYVVWASGADDLVRGDTNGKADVFVRDRVKKRTTRLSVDTHGREVREDSFDPHISSDGSTVVFPSCGNLTGADKAGCAGLFLWRKGRLQRIAEWVNGYQMDDLSISADGRYVAYTSGILGTSCRADVHVYDSVRREAINVTGDIMPLSGRCEELEFTKPRIDGTGRTVTFLQMETGHEFLGAALVRRDLRTAAITTLAAPPDGVQILSFAVSANGRRVAYEAQWDKASGTSPSTVSAVYLLDLATKRTERVSPAPPSPTSDCGLVHPALPPGIACTDHASTPSLSADGATVVFVTNVPIDAKDDTENDVYVRV